MELELGRQTKYFDSSGYVSFILPEGTYEIFSMGEWDYQPVFTIHDNLTLNSNIEMELDERNTHRVSFDSNKPGQIMAETFHGIDLGRWCPATLDDCYYARMGDVWWYPSSPSAYYSYSENMYSIDRYEYYPEEDANPSDPSIIETDVWHDLTYVQNMISSDVDRVADYSQLVTKHTEYRTPITYRHSIERWGWAERWNWDRYYYFGAWTTYIWHLNIPAYHEEIVRRILHTTATARSIGIYQTTKLHGG